MKKVLIGLLLCSIALGLGVFAFAQAPANPPAAPMVPAPRMNAGQRQSYPAPCILGAVRVVGLQSLPFLIDRLKLTSDQQTKVTDILTKADNEAKPLIEAQRKAAESFATAVSKPNAAQSEVTTAGQNAMKAESSLLDQKIKSLFALESVLTDEQKKAFTEVLTQKTSFWQQKPAMMAPQQPGQAPMAPPPAPR